MTEQSPGHCLMLQSSVAPLQQVIYWWSMAGNGGRHSTDCKRRRR